MAMRKLSLILTALTFAASYAAAPVEYHEASEFPVVNRAQPDGSQLRRIDTEKYPDLNDRVRYFYGFPTGLALRFDTNSKNISARWTTNDSIPGVNFPTIAQRGLDLYIKRDGKWIFAGVGRPKYTGTEHSYTIVADMDTATKECLLYLPLYSELHSLEIGLDPGASLNTAVEKPRRKVVFVGSSITHGIGVSRPGMTYPAVLSRRMGFDAPNLGASGMCKLEQFYAQIVCDTEADAFVFDTFSNPSAAQIEKRLMPFVDTIRKCHPDTPLIFLQTEIRESGNFDLKKRAFEAEKRAAAAAGMRKVMEKYDHIYFLDPAMTLGDDHEATTDTTHPSDLGVIRMASTLQPQLEEIFFNEGI